MVKKRWTETDIYRLLVKKFPAPAFVALPQVRNITGYSRRERYADAIVISVWPSRGIFATGIEIKVTRADWRRELADPAKADAIGKYCRYWYVAAPKDIVPLEEVPETWGLLECGGHGIKTVKAAPDRDITQPDWLFTAAVLRAAVQSYVPQYEVQKMIDAAKIAVCNARDATRDRAVEELAMKIRTFEEASGVSLDERWQLENIGEAVKFLRQSGIIRGKRMVENLQRSLIVASSALDKAMVAFEESSESDIIVDKETAR